MTAVMILLKEQNPSNWLSTKKVMNSDLFLPKIVNFNRKVIDPETIERLQAHYKANLNSFGANFTARFSPSEHAFYKWVVFIEDYEALRAVTKPMQSEIKSQTEELRKNVKVLEMLENSEVEVIDEKVNEKS